MGDHEVGPMPDQNGERAQQEAAIDILTKYDPGDVHGRQAFQIQQERRSGGIRVCQAKHQEQGAEHAAEQDYRGEPGQIRSAQRRIDARQPENPARYVNGRKAEARAETEQARHQPRIDRAEQQLGERRACTNNTAEARASGIPSCMADSLRGSRTSACGKPARSSRSAAARE
jgi:hypothetical protein